MSEVVTLCQDCIHLIWSSKQCARAHTAPDFVFGTPAKTRDAQIERENTTEDGCGPKAIHFMPYPVGANKYAEAMTTKDQRERFEGRAGDFGVSACGRSDRAGS